MSQTTDTLATGRASRQPPSGGDNGFKMYGSAAPTISSMLVIELLWRERRFIARFTLCVFAAFTAVAFLLPKSYTAITRLMPPDYGGNLGLESSLPALNDPESGGVGIMGMANRLLGMNTSGELLLGVIQSQSVEDRVIAKCGLMKIYGAKLIEDGRRDLETRTSLASDVKTGIITISVTDRKPALAARIANDYVTELNQALAEVNTSSAHRERVFLEQRLQEVNQQSEDDAKEFALFSSQNAALDIPEQAKSMVAAGAELQSQLIVAQAELKGLQQIYSANNARVRAVRARLEEIQSQLNKFGGKNVNPTRDTSLSPDELYPSVRQLPLLGVKYLDLYRRRIVDEAVFELLTKEYEIAKIQEARAIPTAQVLDPALIPGKKSSPHRFPIMLAGLVAGFVLSSGYLVGRLVWDSASDSDPRRILLLDVFSACQSITSKIPLLSKVRSGTTNCANPKLEGQNTIPG